MNTRYTRSAYAPAYTAPTAPVCGTPGCAREASYDWESDSYSYTCDRCASSVLSSSGLHAHRHSYTEAQCRANGYDPAHTWLTATILHPVVADDVVVGWECRDRLPKGRGECGYSIDAAGMEAFRAYQRGESFLCRVAVDASNGHGIGRETDGGEVWAAFVAMRKALHAARGEDVR